jgi:hypothetical protein
MASLIPYAMMGLPALLSGISGIMGIVDQGRKLKGGRLLKRHYKAHRGGVLRRKKHKKARRRGRGAAADMISSIPLIGSLVGPLVRAMGGRLRRKHRVVRHKGLKGRIPLHKGGLLSPAGGRLARRVGRMRVKHHRRRGHGLSPMYIHRPYVGLGLIRHHRGHGLSPMYIHRPYVGLGLRKHHKGLKGRTPLHRRGGMLTPPGGHYMPLLKQMALTLPAISGPHSKSKLKPKSFPGSAYAPKSFPTFINPTKPLNATRAGLGMLVSYRGTGIHVRRGHYRHLGHRKVRVPRTVVHKKLGGYRPYTFSSRRLISY